MKICTKCKEQKPLSEFNFKIKSRGVYQTHCKECTRLFVKNHYNNNKAYYLKKARRRNIEVKVNIINYLKEYFLAHPCIDCGESDINVLEFDHTGNAPKLKAVSQLITQGYNLNKIEEEIVKCEVRCANCHRRKTAKQFNWWKNRPL